MSAAPHLRFFFLHLMKTGGTTLAWQLRANFPDAQVYPRMREEDSYFAHMSVPALVNLPDEVRHATRLFMGHFPYVASELVGGDLIRFTIVRDPVERTISFLKHWRTLDRSRRDASLEELYDHPVHFPCLIQNHQSKLFAMTEADEPSTFLDPLTVDADRLDVAKVNLDKVDVVGTHERYACFVAELTNRYALRLPAIPKQRVSEPEPVSAAFRARIAADNAMDVEFYEYARARAV